MACEAELPILERTSKANKSKINDTVHKPTEIRNKYELLEVSNFDVDDSSLYFCDMAQVNTSETSKEKENRWKKEARKKKEGKSNESNIEISEIEVKCKSTVEELVNIFEDLAGTTRSKLEKAGGNHAQEGCQRLLKAAADRHEVSKAANPDTRGNYDFTSQLPPRPNQPKSCTTEGGKLDSESNESVERQDHRKILDSAF